MSCPVGVSRKHPKEVAGSYTMHAMEGPMTWQEWHRRSWRAYWGCLVLFSMCGRWPISRVARPNVRGYEGCPSEPPAPPDGLSDERIERVRRMLERQNWTLVRNHDGRLVPCRTI